MSLTKTCKIKQNQHIFYNLQGTVVVIYSRFLLDNILDVCYVFLGCLIHHVRFYVDIVCGLLLGPSVGCFVTTMYITLTM